MADKKKAASKIDKLYSKELVADKPSKESDEDRALIAKARKRATDGSKYWKDNWDKALDDLNFIHVEQWPEGVRNQRVADERPCITNNVLPTFIDQIVGDQRQNRPSIKVSPVGMTSVKSQVEGAQSEELKIQGLSGSDDYKIADVLSGLIRNIEYNCDAETSYDIAFQGAVECGFGYLRVLSDYESDESFDQELKITHIENQFAVTIDPNARERDRSDMAWCLIDEVMMKEEFKAKYPNATADALTDGSSGNSGVGDWFADNTVRVSEYFTREPVDKEILLLSDGRSVFKDDIEGVIDELAEKGVTITRTRKVKEHEVMWRKITGQQVLEGPIEVKCSTIPVVPVWGKCSNIKKKFIVSSLIRNAKDAQRMSNYWDSAGIETIALAPKAPFVGSEGHTEGYEDDWKNANKTNAAILTYVPQFQNDPGPRRQQTAAVPAAEITMGMNSSDKIKNTIGMYDASMGAQSNETSGKAILARQRQGDRGSFAFIDNLNKSIRRVGKILVEMIPHIYDSERVVRIKFEDGTEDYVRLNESVFDEQTEKWVNIADLNIVKYDVVVTSGPSHSTQRQEAAESLIQFAQAVPASAAVIADLIAQNMDFPGAETMAARLKKIVPPAVLSKKDREEIAKDAPEPPEPTPEQALQMAELDVKGKEIEADGLKAQANIAQAQTDLIKAQLESETAKAKLLEIQNGKGDAYQQVREIVAQVIAEMQGKQQTIA